MSKTIRSILNVIIYVLIIGGTVYGLPKFLTWSLGTTYPLAAVTSGSMWPVLHEGDLVLIKGAGKDEIAIGDVVVFQNESGNGFTIHRIVRLGEKTFTTKGDANFSDDKPVPYDRLVGKNLMVLGKHARIPFMGSITVWASSLMANVKY